MQTELVTVSLLGSGLPSADEVLCHPYPAAVVPEDTHADMAVAGRDHDGVVRCIGDERVMDLVRRRPDADVLTGGPARQPRPQFRVRQPSLTGHELRVTAAVVDEERIDGDRRRTHL